MITRLTLCLLSTAWLLASGAPVNAQPALSRLVKKIQPAVATVIVYDAERNIANIGTGFFVSPQGHLITNHHVLAGKFFADVRTFTGKSYPVRAVLAENKAADLLKLKVDIPAGEVKWLAVNDRMPAIAERVVVVGSPMGLEQTVSEGIVSSVRETSPVGPVFQMSAPISPGSSGSPVVDPKGEVIGIATFQFIQGQNLNFAVAARQILALKKTEGAPSVSEWTFGLMGKKPRLAEELCEKGIRFSLDGKDRQALQYFEQAAEKDPGDPAAWSGLGSCYAGLDHQSDAVEAFKKAVQADPRNEISHYNLANYYGKIGRHEEAVSAYREAIRIDPKFEAAHFNLGMAFIRLGRHDEGRQAFEAVADLNPGAAPAHYNAGIAYGQMGRHEEAIAAQKRVIRIDPDFAPAHYALGASAGKLGRAGEEFEAYKEAIRADPDFAPAHHAIGEVFLRRGDRGGALEEYKILKKMDPDLARDLFDQIYRPNEPT
jgi:tetratricopeptide (TPR) repeat protein